MARRTLDNYTRQMEPQPIHCSYRFDIEFQEEEQDYSWNIFTRGKWQVDDNDQEVFEEVVRLQRLYPNRDFRIVKRVETETRSEPYHPEYIRKAARIGD